jgi:ribonuclease Z
MEQRPPKDIEGIPGGSAASPPQRSDDRSPAGTPPDGPEGHGVTRRQLVAGALATGIASSALLSAACGTDEGTNVKGDAVDEPAAGTSTGASWSTEPIGEFKLGTELGAGEMRISFMGTSFLPRIGQQANSVFVETGDGQSFVFDYGSGVSSKYTAMGVSFGRQDKVFITHLHGDHTSDLITLYCFGPANDRKWPLSLYGPSGPSKDQGTEEWGKTLKKLMAWHEDAFSFLPTGTKGKGDGYEIITKELPYMKVGTAYDENGVKITHFPAVHDRDGSISYRLEWNGLSMVFTGDTKPSNYSIDNGKDVDVFIHEMVVPVDVWASKNSGLQPGDQGWDQAVNAAQMVQDSSHTPEQALGYILEQVKPRLGVATHFQVNADTIDQAVKNVQSWYKGPFAIATDLLVITASKDDIKLEQATVDDYAWYPPPLPIDPNTLMPAKYPSPTAQLNQTLLDNCIPADVYTPGGSASPGASPSASAST